MPRASSLRANGSRECAPDDRLREAIYRAAKSVWIASSLPFLAMTLRDMSPHSRGTMNEFCFYLPPKTAWEMPGERRITLR
jgi:hypothetical protein